MSRCNEGRIEYNDTLNIIQEIDHMMAHHESATNILTMQERVDMNKARGKYRKILARTTNLSINDNEP